MDQNMIMWAIACGGWLIAVLLAYLGYLERKANQQSELLLKTVSYFDGGTQKRSIGIALIEGLLQKDAQHRQVLVPLLTNQFVYLLLHPDVKASPHEERNLIRLFFLLAATPNLRTEHFDSYGEIADAIARRLDGEASGIIISQPTLDLWTKKLGVSDAKEA
jgi:hypothetical protein